METFTNIQEANQRIGAMGVELQTEKEARAAVTSDLENAKASHATEIETLNAQHSAELEALRGENAKAVTQLNDKLTAVTEENEKLKADAKSADAKAADIVSAQGGDPVEPEGDDEKTTGPKTQEELTALWQEHSKLPVAEKRAFYLERIKPHLSK